MYLMLDFYYLDKPTCCGSSVPHIATIPTGSFSRTIAGTSFYVNQAVALGEDPYPPGRITDLRVERQIDSTSEVKLSWTACGGDYDKGKGIFCNPKSKSSKCPIGIYHIF